MGFGTASRVIREYSGLRKEDLAHLAGLSQGYLSQLESGIRRLANIDKILDFLDWPRRAGPSPAWLSAQPARLVSSTEVQARHPLVSEAAADPQVHVAVEDGAANSPGRPRRGLGCGGPAVCSDRVRPAHPHRPDGHLGRGSARRHRGRALA
ncbi:helix-turn-helix domain-containing protein [Streptomyces koyangensis]